MKNSKKMRSRRSDRGSATIAVLGFAILAGSLSTSYVMRTLQERGRESFDKDSATSLYDAWSQMEVVGRIINSSGYDGLGRNNAVQQALARADDQFVDFDGWPTGVVCTAVGAANSGLFDMISTATVGSSTTRVSSLMTERQSFADFNYFVAQHSLGISGGSSAAYPYVDAPEGTIHSNDRVIFYFPDRHFRDTVTAVNGFGYTAGARGVLDPSGQNNWFHGDANDHIEAITGLTDVDIPAVAARADNLLALTGPYDFAKVKLKGTTALIEHWMEAYSELQTTTVMVPAFHYNTVITTVPVYTMVPTQVATQVAVYKTITVPVLTTSTVVDVAGYFKPVTTTKTVYTTVVDTPAWTEVVVVVQNVPTQVWVAGGGGGDTGGAGGSGAVGYWTTVNVPTNVNTNVVHPAITHQVASTVTTTADVWVPPVTHTVTTQTGTTTKQVVDYYNTVYVTKNVKTQTGTTTKSTQVKVNDPPVATQVQTWVTIPEHKVADHVVNAYGTVYVSGRIHFVPMAVASGDPYDVQVLDGSLTFASGANVYLEETIQYGHPDSGGVMQTPYLNGADHTKPYTRNDLYKGSSVLGIVAATDIVYTSKLPTEAELNATLLAKNGEVRVEGVSVASDGTVTETAGGWIKTSLRRLGGITSNYRPVSAYVNSSSAVTRGFVFGKSIFDVRQRTNPPAGFPSIHRPRVLSTVLREVK